MGSSYWPRVGIFVSAYGQFFMSADTRVDIGIQHPLITPGTERLNLSDRVVRPPPGPKTVGDRQEVGLENRLQHQLQRGLNHSMGNGRDPQLAELARPTRFRNLALPYRHRTKRAVLERRTELVQEPWYPEALLDVGGSNTVNTGRVAAPVARDLSVPEAHVVSPRVTSTLGLC